METRVKTHMDITVITITGNLDIEVTQPFKKACLDHLTQKKVVFNMQKTHFVGSTGVQPFIETIKSLSTENQHGLKLVGLQPEFKRIFQNLDLAKLEFHDSETAALGSFEQKIV